LLNPLDKHLEKKRVELQDISMREQLPDLNHLTDREKAALIVESRWGEERTQHFAATGVTLGFLRHPNLS
jgi:hypothetical protein